MSALFRIGRRAEGIHVTLLAVVFANFLLLMTASRRLPTFLLPICLSAGLDRGFLRLYDLDFSGAQIEFASWEKLES